MEVLAGAVPEGAMGGDVASISGSGTANGGQGPNLLSSICRVGTRMWVAGSIRSTSWGGSIIRRTTRTPISCS